MQTQTPHEFTPIRVDDPGLDSNWKSLLRWLSIAARWDRGDVLSNPQEELIFMDLRDRYRQINFIGVRECEHFPTDLLNVNNWATANLEVDLDPDQKLTQLIQIKVHPDRKIPPEFTGGLKPLRLTVYPMLFGGHPHTISIQIKDAQHSPIDSRPIEEIWSAVWFTQAGKYRRTGFSDYCKGALWAICKRSRNLHRALREFAEYAFPLKTKYLLS